jgi:hypothetical protein
MSAKSPDTRLDELLRELYSVQQELAQAPKGELARQHDLREREGQLRAELREFSTQRPDPKSIDQLRRLIARTERRISEHYGNRLSYTSGPQTGYGGGLDPKILHRMHRAMDRSADLPGMRAELARLRQELAVLEKT